MTLGQVLLFDQLTIKLSKKNNKLRRRTKVKSPDWPLMPGQRPPSPSAFFSTIDSSGKKHKFLEPPTESTPPKKESPKNCQQKQRLTTTWQPPIYWARHLSCASQLPCFQSVPVSGAAAVIRLLYDLSLF